MDKTTTLIAFFLLMSVPMVLAYNEGRFDSNSGIVDSINAVGNFAKSEIDYSGTIKETKNGYKFKCNMQAVGVTDNGEKIRIRFNVNKVLSSYEDEKKLYFVSEADVIYRNSNSEGEKLPFGIITVYDKETKSASVYGVGDFNFAVINMPLNFN